MMNRITLSVMFGDHETLCLDQFEAKTRRKVELVPFKWKTGWNELLSISLHNRGPDVSHIGNTWLGSLVSIQALRAFSKSELDCISDQKKILPNAWKTTLIPNKSQQFAIPWTLDTRVILYRRDWLKKAGVNESGAFNSHEALEETLSRLRNAGFEHPWSVSMLRNTAHISAPWVWKNGGDFRAADLHNLAFTEPATLRGLSQFISLYRYAYPVKRGLTIEEVAAQFRNGQIGVIYTTHHLVSQFLLENPPPFGIQNLGVSKVPGPPYLGGNSLVIWKHSIQEQLAIDLINHLISIETQYRLSTRGIQIPVRAEVLEQEPFKNQALFEPIIESLHQGRVFHSSSHWATVEERLNLTLNRLWIDLFANPRLDLCAELDKRLTKLSETIQKTFLENC